MHEVLVKRLGGLSLPRKSVVRLTDRLDMTLDVYRGSKKTTQQQQFGQHMHLGIQPCGMLTYILMLHFFLLFLSPLVVCNHDTLQTLKYGQDRFSSINHVWMRPSFFFIIDFIICFTDFMLFPSPCIGDNHDTYIWARLFH